MQKEVAINREWYPNLDFKSEHSDFPVRQVTCFITTKDRKLLLVSKDGQNWSITAGHYESRIDSSYIDTAIREVYEESGLDISSYINNIKKLGYYLIKEVDWKKRKVLDTYLQLRTFLPLDIESKEIILEPVKDDLVKYARFFSFEDSMKLVKWLQDSGEWKAIKKLFKHSAQV